MNGFGELARQVIGSGAGGEVHRLRVGVGDAPALVFREAGRSLARISHRLKEKRGVWDAAFVFGSGRTQLVLSSIPQPHSPCSSETWLHLQEPPQLQ